VPSLICGGSGDPSLKRCFEFQAAREGLRRPGFVGAVRLVARLDAREDLIVSSSFASSISFHLVATPARVVCELDAEFATGIDPSDEFRTVVRVRDGGAPAKCAKHLVTRSAASWWPPPAAGSNGRASGGA
jgi:hypothetical protein